MLTPIRVASGRVLSQRGRSRSVEPASARTAAQRGACEARAPGRHVVQRSSSWGRCVSIIGGLPDVALRLHELMVRRLRRRARRRHRAQRRCEPPVPRRHQRPRRRLSRRRGDAAGDAARARRDAPAAGVLRLPAALPVHRHSDWAGAAFAKASGQRPARSLFLFNRYVAGARRRGRGRQLPAALRAGDQPVRAARRPHRDRRRRHRVPRRARAHRAARLRGLRHPRRCSGFDDDSEELVFLPLFARRRPSPAGHRLLQRLRASRGCCPIAASAKGRARATSAPRSSSRWSIRATRRTAARCASSARRSAAPTATCRCSCRSAPGPGRAHARTCTAPVESIHVVAGPVAAAQRDARRRASPGGCSACCRSTTCRCSTSDAGEGAPALREILSAVRASAPTPA